jgi:hypothetical protein
VSAAITTLHGSKLRTADTTVFDRHDHVVAGHERKNAMSDPSPPVASVTVNRPEPTDQAAVALAPAQANIQHHGPFRVDRSWKIGAIAAVVMILLALIGVGLTMANRSAASAYWISLVPLYGLLCMWLTSFHARAHGRPYMIWRQAFHWTGVGVAVCLDFFIGSTTLVTAEGVGINALLLLALGCFLAGIHFDWLFVVVGVLLTATMVVVVQAEQYVWLMFGVGVVALIVIFLLNRYLRPSETSTVTVTGSSAS